MLIDLHAKTDLSEGVSLSARQVLESASAAGLDAIAVSETLNSARCREILELAKSDFPNIKVFIGVEIPTDRGILLGFVPEIGDFYLAEEWRWLAFRTTPSAQAVLDLFDSHNGVVIAARPYDLEIPFNMGDYIFTFDRLGAVEVFNPQVGAIQNNFALEAATFMGLCTVGGSDPRGDASVIGQYATFFDEDITTQAQFVEALKDSEYWAVQIGAPEQPKERERGRDRRSRGEGRRRRSTSGRRRNSRRPSSRGRRSRGQRSRGRGRGHRGGRNNS